MLIIIIEGSRGCLGITVEIPDLAWNESGQSPEFSLNDLILVKRKYNYFASLLPLHSNSVFLTPNGSAYLGSVLSLLKYRRTLDMKILAYSIQMFLNLQ